jgi:hypothetical protein
MSVKSAAAIVSTVTATVLLGLAPTPALARPPLPYDTGVVETATTVVPLPPGGVIDCTADPAFRFARPCLIRGIPVLSPMLGWVRVSHARPQPWRSDRRAHVGESPRRGMGMIGDRP